MMTLLLPRFPICLLGLLFVCSAALAAETPSWSIPVGGNAYLTASKAGSQDGLSRGGNLRWQEAESVFSVYFRVDRACELDLVLKAKVAVAPPGSRPRRAR